MLQPFVDNEDVAASAQVRNQGNMLTPIWQGKGSAYLYIWFLYAYWGNGYIWNKIQRADYLGEGLGFGYDVAAERNMQQLWGAATETSARSWVTYSLALPART